MGRFLYSNPETRKYLCEFPQAYSIFKTKALGRGVGGDKQKNPYSSETYDGQNKVENILPTLESRRILELERP